MEEKNQGLALQSNTEVGPAFALVAEGGGQKGIFTAGVLDAFLEQQFWPFDLKIGVSAGAQNLAAFSARARQYASQAIQQLTTKQDFFRPAKFFMGGNVIDLDWYFRQVQEQGEMRFPTDVSHLNGESGFYAVATDAADFQPVYLPTNNSNLFHHLKASSAIPFLYRPGVWLEGRQLVDGGVADPLPVRWAYAQGAKRIVVIRTVAADYSGQVPLLERLKPLLKKVRHSPRMMEMYLHYQRQYADALAFINQPPDGVQVWQIAPPQELRSLVLGSPPQALKLDYLIGRREGQRFLRQWNKDERRMA
ncbi:patatin family protein [Bowmanella denitrificans]|uniref:Patatin family protein n=1 Tax=Bowmanella denitrificans TaxID=366582 RepID=A0ABP3HQ94_9ALTE